jgi:hydrogenase expression/formation protein HypD
MTDLQILRAEHGVRALTDEVGTVLRAIGRQVNLMEVCGTHTMTAYRSGLGLTLRKMGMRLISGPGCPVCVTPDGTIAAAARLVQERPGVILASFGDMLRVPASDCAIMKLVPADGSSVRVIYSPEEVVELAKANPQKEVVFLAAGFETTVPGIGWVVKTCLQDKISNVSLLPAMKLVPPPLKAILDAGELRVDGFIYPGHVSVIIGSEAYRFIAEEYGVPGAVAGFEPADLLFGILSVLKQIRDGRAEVDIAYRRAVKPEGNPLAKRLISEVFTVGDAEWRGFGTIPLSGLFPPPELCALSRFGIKAESGWETEGCRCGEVVRGITEPEDCPLFGTGCTPERPLGPCMVSYEGSCLIHFKYGREVPL